MLRWESVPVLPGVVALAGAGHITGASGRNWAGYGASIRLDPAITSLEQAILCDPQTSGGLLVSCDPATTPAVLDLFRQQGFHQAAVIGRLVADIAGPGVDVTVGG